MQHAPHIQHRHEDYFLEMCCTRVMSQCSYYSRIPPDRPPRFVTLLLTVGVTSRWEDDFSEWLHGGRSSSSTRAPHVAHSMPYVASRLNVMVTGRWEDAGVACRGGHSTVHPNDPHMSRLSGSIVVTRSYYPELCVRTSDLHRTLGFINVMEHCVKNVIRMQQRLTVQV